MVGLTALLLTHMATEDCFLSRQIRSASERVVTQATSPRGCMFVVERFLAVTEPTYPINLVGFESDVERGDVSMRDGQYFGVSTFTKCSTPITPSTGLILHASSKLCGSGGFSGHENHAGLKPLIRVHQRKRQHG